MPRSKSLDRALSETAAVAAADRRAQQRFVTIYRPGKLVRGNDEELCLVRNVSVAGAMVQVGVEYAVDDEVVLYLRLEDPIKARVAWTREGFIGLAFASPIDLAERVGPARPGEPKPRAPRLNIPVAARIQLGRDIVQVVTSDISQSGAKLCCGIALAPGTEMRLTIDGLGTFTCIVRWAKQGVTGVAFVKPIAIWELSEWARSRRAVMNSSLN
jgi:hypothetical protein